MDTTANAPALRSHTAALFVLIAWFSLITILGFNQFFVPLQGETPANILLSIITSLGLFALLYLNYRPFREYVLALDMRLLIMLHSWRMLGLGFIMLYMLDNLPPLFAFLAGLGDALAAIAAVFIAYQLFTSHNGVYRKNILRWNTFGLVDFIVAVSIGILTQTDAPLYAESGISSDIMVSFPFVIIPGFLVQLLTITHIIIYLQLRNNHPQQQRIKL